MTDLVKKEANAVMNITEDQWQLIKRTLVDSEHVRFTDDEFRLFMNQAKRTGLDPFTRQIYATKIKGKVSVQATVDGLRVVAQRSTFYAGQTRPVWFDKDGKEYRVWTKKGELPFACEVGVLRHDFKEPLYAVAVFDEYAQRNKDGELGYMWKRMPALMIAKVAEALALRKAFPNDLSGIYADAEMQQAANPDSHEIKPARPVSEAPSLASSLINRDPVLENAPPPEMQYDEPIDFETLPASKPAQPAVPPSGHYEVPDMCRLLSEANPNGADFYKSLAQWYGKHGKLSPKQDAMLKKDFARFMGGK